jgi:uncharacterized protein
LNTARVAKKTRAERLRFRGIVAGAFVILWAHSLFGAPKKVLVVTVTLEYRHSSIPTAEKVLSELGEKSGAYAVSFARVDPSEPQFQGTDGKTDSAKVHAAIKEVLARTMSVSALSNYDGVIFANTTGELPLPDKEAFMAWLRSGKGFIGMHAASDTLHQFQPYIRMLGGEFFTHGAQIPASVINEDPDCPACRRLPHVWNVFDEIYVFQKFEARRSRLLLSTTDSITQEGGMTPVSWSRTYGQGRVFYTSLGHREDVWDPRTPASYQRQNPPEVAEAFQKHILAGIKWALRLEDWDAKQITPSPK